jgi:tRNA nucleotidyltransferase/poly(A) polymerase
MRDMLAGFRIRDLDFAVEGNALKVAKALGENAGAQTVLEDDNRKSAELVFPTGVTAQIAMSRQEKSARAGGKAAGERGHHPRGPQGPRLHVQRHRAVAKQGFARACCSTL